MGITFIISSVTSQMLLLPLLCGLLTLPFLLVSKRVYFIVASLIATSGILLLVIDTFVFAQYRFHLNAVVVELALSGQVVDFSIMNKLMIFVLFMAVLSIEYFLLTHLFSRDFFSKTSIIKKFVGLLFVTLLLTNSIHIWAVANTYQPVTMVKRYLPLFYPATANSLMKKYGWIDLAALTAEKNRKIDVKGDLNYPISPLQTHQPTKLNNIVFIVIDSWRFDTFNTENTPNIARYAEQGKVFKNHYSTGNATRTGIFGLFYGISGTYWHSFLANQQSPILIQRMQSLGYQMGIFASAHLTNPEFNQTVFRNIPNLRVSTEGESPSSRDTQLTNDWMDWYGQQDRQKPTFSFLFYDAPHGYDFPKTYPEVFSPMAESVDYLALNNNYDATPLFNRYKNSVHFVDSLVADVFEMIESRSEFDDTVFVITGDHGQELNDNKLNFWGHNSNFTDAQIKVPFIVITPENKAHHLDNRMTSHQDVAPTILKNYLGVDSALFDYSLGMDLLDTSSQREWVLSSSYNAYGIIDDKSILEVDNFGQYQQLDKSNRPNKAIEVNYQHLQQALNEMKQFMK
jgi:membrane-anchored protein YejM (alkaline phosphatase superfamily)